MRWILLSIVVGSTVLGDLLQSHEMKRSGEQSVGLRGLARILQLIATQRYLLIAIVCMAISFFAFMALVQVEPMSFAVPASAASFVLETVLAKVLLKEHISSRRALGALLVLCGVVLVAR